MPFFNNAPDKLERKRFNELWYVCHENEQASEISVGYFVTILFGFMWSDINDTDFNTLDYIIFFESKEDAEMGLVDLGYDVDYNTSVYKKEDINNFTFVKIPAQTVLTAEIVPVWVTEETFNKICRDVIYYWGKTKFKDLVKDYPDYFNESSFYKFLNESKLTNLNESPFFYNRLPFYNPNEEFKGTEEEYKRLNKQILHDNSGADKGIPFYLDDVEVDVNDVTITIDQYEFLYDANRPYSNPLIYDLGEFLNISVNSLKDIIENWEYDEEKFQDFLLDKYREEFEDEARNDTDAVSRAGSEYVDRYSDDDY